MQLNTKGNKLVGTLFIRGRHNKTGIIQCEQFTQATAPTEKATTDFFVLISPFNESTAQYYHKKIMPTLTAKSICRLGLLAEEKTCKEDNLELRYLIIIKFGDINMGYKYRVRPFEDGNYAIAEINYIGNDMKLTINIDKSRLDTTPHDDEDDCLIGCKCTKCKQWEPVNGIKRNLFTIILFNTQFFKSVQFRDFINSFNLFLCDFIAAYLLLI